MTGPKDKSFHNKRSMTYITEDKFFVKLFHNTLIPKSLSRLSDRQLVDVNEAWENYTGYSKDEVIGFTVEELDLISINEADQIREALDKVKIIKSFEVELKVKEGQIKYGYATFQFFEINGIDYVQTTILDITKLKEAQEKIRMAKGFSEELILSLRSGLVVMNLEGEIIDVNPSFCEITKFTESELLGTKAPFPFWPRESYDAIQECLKKTLQGQVGNFEFLLIRKNGERFPAALATNSVKDNSGEITAYFVTIDDITQRKRAEEQLINNERLFRRLTSNAPVGIFQTDKQGFCNFVNEQWIKYSGISFEDAMGYGWSNAIHPDDKEKVLVNWQNCVLHEKKFVAEFRFQDKKKNITWLSVEAVSIHDAHDNLYGYIGMALDITDRKEVENQLLESERYLENIINAVGDPLFVKDEQSRLLLVNEAFCDIFGLSKSEVIGRTLAEDVSPEEKESFLRIDKEVLSTGIENVNEESLTVRDNESKIVLTKKTRFIDNKGNKFLVGVITDITERKRAEEKILESEFNLRQSQIVANIGSYTFDFKTMTWTSSDVLDKILGIDNTVDRTIEGWMNLVHPDDREFILNYFENNVIKNREKFDKEYRIVRPTDHKTYWMHGLGELVFDDSGALLKMIGTTQDITERKKAHDKLLESEYNLRQSQIVANIGSYVLDLNLMTWTSSEALDKIFGIDESFERTIEGWVSLIHPEDREIMLDHFQNNVLKNHEKFNKEYRILRPSDNKTLWLHGLGELVFDDAKNPIKMIGTIQDITERKKSEIELKLAKSFTDKLIMSMQEGLFIVDLQGKILMVNDSTCNILGYSREELIGLELPYPFAKGEDFEEIAEKPLKISKGEAPSFQFEFIKKNGKKFQASFLTGNIKNDQGEVIALFGTMKDVSEELKIKHTLEEIAEKSTQKKNAIIKLSGLVGTDYKNALKQITSLSAETLNVARVSIWKFNADRSEILCEQLYDLKTGKYESGIKINKKDNINYFKALSKNKTISVNDAVSNNITKDFAENYLIPYGITSMLDVFIQRDKKSYGIICFEHIGPKRKWTSDEEQFASSIANVVSLMVENLERKLAEEKLISINKELITANEELEKLRNQLEDENVYLRNEIDLVFNYEEMVYGSEVFSHILTDAEKVAVTNATVLLLGESGTGKELLARAIHNISERQHKPLIKVNCAAIPRELIESELFGHIKGAFTGATNDKIGKAELADGGTLFLDEIGELPLDMQPKLLRFLQEGEIEKVGSSKSLKVDVRIIAATNKKLKKEVKEKRFREDLYFRLNVFPISVPHLRQRREDIPLLVEHFANKFSKAYGKDVTHISDMAMQEMLRYDWPGNIRELENLIERAVILSNNKFLVLPDFDSSINKKERLISSTNITLNDVQRAHITKILQKCNWKIDGTNGAAVLLDIKPSTLRDRMKKLGVQKPR